MQRAMWSARPGGAAGPSSCFGVWPANCLCSQRSVECQTEFCPWAQAQRVAPQASAAVAPVCATCRSHRAHRLA
eukprot:5278864-Pyramimonas_sp.AAC.1